MQRYNPLLRSTAQWSTRLKPQSCLPTQPRHSSGSPTKTNVPADHFIKTGEKPQDPADKGTTGNDIQTQKDRAGKGNVVNPLELSPATSELSSIISEEYTSKSEERQPGAVSGQSSGRKTKTVKKTEIDFK
ncbi:hypothetical protein E8E11_007185 [Didymella keratinophila]|nr:hypothetical protein E8E11_007185 [Didymella keratinophila]